MDPKWDSWRGCRSDCCWEIDLGLMWVGCWGTGWDLMRVPHLDQHWAWSWEVHLVIPLEFHLDLCLGWSLG